MTTPEPVVEKSEGFARFWPPVVLLGLMWIVQAVDAVLPLSFTGFGVRSWNIEGLRGILFSPFLHTDWAHLTGNSLPFLVLGCLIAAEGAKRYWLITGIVALVAGLGVWIVNAPGTLTVGASGLVFGYFAYIVVRVFVVRGLAHRFLSLIVAVAVVIVYGATMFSGILPIHDGISWQGHLFGGIGGVLAGVLLRPKKPGQDALPQRLS